MAVLGRSRSGPPPRSNPGSAPDDVRRKTVHERLQELAREERADAKQPLIFGRSGAEARSKSQRIKQFTGVRKRPSGAGRNTDVVKLKMAKKTTPSGIVSSAPDDMEGRVAKSDFKSDFKGCIPKGSVRQKVDAWGQMTKEEQQEKLEPETEDWLQGDYPDLGLDILKY